MPITTRLSRTLHEAPGDEAATDLVDWMQTVAAQRAELRELNELNFIRFDSRLNEVRHELRAEIADVRQEMRVGFADLRAALATVGSKIDRRVGDRIKWSFLVWCGAVAAATLARG
ncbi:MAG TPA: hypothetical protein VIH11_06035 [Gemmatimonadaceae bacterium]|nr:hypothetical protein [Gemmatimonadaceae bacterium]